MSEGGDADQKADIILRTDWQPKSLATKIELTLGQITLGILLIVGLFVGVALLLTTASFIFGW